METINVVLSPDMQNFVQRQVSSGEFSSASEYVCSLIQADYDCRVDEVLEAEILKGLHSGDSTPMTTKDWAELRRELLLRHGR